MKSTQNNATGSKQVQEYLAETEQPLRGIMQEVRRVILSAGNETGEEMK